MLERFKVPLKDQVRVPEQSLRRTVAAIFEKMGETPEDAATGADVLVTTDLRGVETHGVSNLMRTYVERYTSGGMKPRPDWRIVRESPATATVDADTGLATILGPKMMGIAIDKAREVGIGVVTVRNAGHSGAIGHHAMLAAKQDMVGVTMTAGGTGILPTFGAEPRFGTNPIAIAAPARDEAPFLFDVATSAIAGNKTVLARRVGATVEPNWISEPDGNPITDGRVMPEPGEYHMLPLGGTRENGSHKGYGFAMMAEILATLLSGSLPSMLEGSQGSHHYFAAYNVSAFTEVEAFKDTMDRTLRTLRTTKPAPGFDRVLYPGLLEHEEELERRANGIPLHREVVEWFQDITAELSLPSLETV
jgi:LDH2 family malate/lactate/ureidoglycolate dehydrogenase